MYLCVCVSCSCVWFLVLLFACLQPAYHTLRPVFDGGTPDVMLHTFA